MHQKAIVVAIEDKLHRQKNKSFMTDFSSGQNCYQKSPQLQLSSAVTKLVVAWC